MHVFRRQAGLLIAALLLLCGFGRSAIAQTTTSFMVAGPAVNPLVILPIIQGTGATQISALYADHFDVRYGAAGQVIFGTTGTSTLTIDADFAVGGPTVAYSVDGGAYTTLTNAGRANYTITLPNGSDHAVIISSSPDGHYSSFYSITTQTGGGFRSLAGTLPNGTPGYGTGLCTLNLTATAVQNWLDLGGGCWSIDPDDYVDQVDPHVPAQANSAVQVDVDLRFYAKGSAIWVYCRQSGALINVRVDGVAYTPVQLAIGTNAGHYQWYKLLDSTSVPAFNSSTYHEVVLSMVKQDGGNSWYVAGLMAGGSGSAIQTSAITRRNLIAGIGDSITVANSPTAGVGSSDGWLQNISIRKGVGVGNLGIFGATLTEHYWPATGLVGAGSDAAAQTASISYRCSHPSLISIPALNVVPKWIIMLVGTNDYFGGGNTVQVPLLPTSDTAILNRDFNGSLAAGFTATGGTSTTLTSSYGFTNRNQGQMITCVTGANAGKSAFISSVSGGTVTFEPMGAPTLVWNAVQAGDTFSVRGVNFYDQYIKAVRSIRENPTFANTPVLILGQLRRVANSPAGSQGAGTTPYQISDMQATTAQIAADLQAIYGTTLVRYLDMSNTLQDPADFYDHLHPNTSGNLKIANAVLGVIYPDPIFRRGNGGRAGSRSDSALNDYGVSPLIIAQLSQEPAYTH